MTYRLRITLSMIVAAALLFAIGGAALISASFTVSVEKEEQTAVDNTKLTLRMLEMVGETENWFDEKDLTDTLRRISERGDYLAIRLMRADGSSGNASGNSSGSSGNTSGSSGNASGNASGNSENASGNENAPEILYTQGDTAGFPKNITEVGSGKIEVTYPYAGTGTPYLLTVSRLEMGADAYVLQVARDLSPVYRVRAQQTALFGRIYMILILSSAVLSWLLATLLTRSLRKLSKASREIASGNLSYRSGIKAEDEIGELSREFDRMAENLEENMHRIQEEADRKERFMGAFTHELKTPMTSIIGYADLLRSQDLTPEEREDALNYIFSEGKRLENMSLKLLDLFVADKTEIELRDISVESLLGDVTEHLRPAFSKEGIVLDAEADEGTCMVEPDLFRTLLINLMDNARKAMPEGGAIRVRAQKEGMNWHFTVRDTGKGMAPEEIAHITEAFYRIDKARARKEGSAGLGLALCEKIVTLHRGTLRFESAPGEGTTVHVTVPSGHSSDAERNSRKEADTVRKETGMIRKEEDKIRKETGKEERL